ncbi:hypothetical protein BCR43DRAFT_497501 [Syncephalastrum racemosum]|uniref:RxLR effector protein n=1 Tax=Syncephalastrum racemosum TaxID=13706 RepID=A0A1X2H291_SYNRA|nr:hypothetical protein BCR43DRAFT_497501 [Syncephalastrum racemosum]
MQLTYFFALFALVATVAFADSEFEGSNTAIGDTSGLLNNVLAKGLLNDNSQKQETEGKSSHRYYSHHRWD